MGQGNSRLIIYKNNDESTGVLYDLGSKSLQTHPKFMLRGEWKQNFINKPSGNEEQDQELPAYEDTLQIKSITPMKKVLVGNTIPVSVSKKLDPNQSKAIKKQLKDFICEKLRGLNHLFIFLSHSDEDHINFINSETIPAEVPVTIFLAGDWFGNVGCKKEETNLTNPVKDVITFLKNKLKNNPDKFHFNFPYYNDFSPTKDENGEPVKFNVLIRQLLMGNKPLANVLQELSGYCLRTNLNAPNPRFFSGNLIKLYNLSVNRPYNEKIIDDLTNSVAKYIHIWGLNHQTDDINGHSLVLSCTLPTLDLSVILAGDAQHSVFQHIASEYKEAKFREILGLNDEHIVTFMLPHHGSEENSSGTALNFFTPNVFGVPAGDGGQYGHPSLSLIQNIENVYSIKGVQNIFDQRYLMQEDINFVSMQDGIQNFMKREDNYHMPFLCPNLYGCIKWDKKGISTNFDDAIVVEGKKYKIMYLSHVWEANKNILKSMVKKRDITVYNYKDETQTTIMRVVVAPSNVQDNYMCILKIKGQSELFAGMAVGDKLYFYKLISDNS